MMKKAATTRQDGVPERARRTERFRKAFLLVLAVLITLAFLWVIWEFVMTVLLAAIFAGLLHPLFRRLTVILGGRAALASVITLLLAFFLVAGPLLTVAGAVVNEAIQISQTARPTVEGWVKEPGRMWALLEQLPFADRLAPYRQQILTRAAELTGNIGSIVVAQLSDTTRGTVRFLLHFFLMLYAMFFFLKDGPGMLHSVVTYLPLDAEDREEMLDRFVSVTRATLKGTVLIGAIQGTLCGLAFWVLGIGGAVFWGVIMVVLSIIPAVGGALVWVPAAIFIAMQGHWVKAIILTAFCGLVVGSIDNVLRPRLVGRDTRLHDLMILFSTLGGLLVFGVLGFILGPILAALFVTVWEIFGRTYHDVLPEVPES
ncbi:MAG: AI-2E family transporter [Vicinamibacteraceae bacterium]|nr:AI-2E family transporter [Vicinamibacteraceae bacterium]